MKEIFLIVFLLQFDGTTGTLTINYPFTSLGACTAVIAKVVEALPSPLPEGASIISTKCIRKGETS